MDASGSEARCATGSDVQRQGCCLGEAEAEPMSRLARGARVAAGIGFLAAAGALRTRSLPGRVALGPTAVVPTWFGVSHLVAAGIGYRGCPELGAIPSVMLARRVQTSCGPWERFDDRFERS